MRPHRGRCGANECGRESNVDPWNQFGRGRRACSERVAHHLFSLESMFDVSAYLGRSVLYERAMTRRDLEGPEARRDESLETV